MGAGLAATGCATAASDPGNDGAELPASDIVADGTSPAEPEPPITDDETESDEGDTGEDTDTDTGEDVPIGPTEAERGSGSTTIR